MIMENVFLYLIKASGLITVFYLAYILLLRKETFFTGNRWFLLLGLFTSAILPLFFITKIIWVEPTTNSFDWSNIPITTVENNPEPEINWSLIAIVIYFLGSIVLFAKLLFDLYSLSKVFKGKVNIPQGKFKLIDVTENIAPFSFFKSIVYNSSLYSPTEIENILEHEKVHSSQNHSIDVLLSRLFCIAFWFNPLIWLYKKAMIQNLEFIADSEATKNTLDKKAYQLTLLKITTQENCVAITNHFYQSLIKKRIIMMNKNQSKKSNSWKYITVFPALVAFVFLFQIEVVAQERPIKNEVKETKKDSTELKSFKIEKDLSNLSKDKDIYINGEKSTQEELDKLNPNDIETIDVSTISGKKTVLVTTKNTNNKNSTDKIIVKATENTTLAQLDDNKKIRSVLIQDLENKPLIILNGYKTPPGFKIKDIPTDQIAKIEVLKGIHAITKYGKKGENDVIEITTKEKNTKKEFELSNDNKVIGYKTIPDQEISGWKNKATDTLDVKIIITTPETDIDKALIFIDGKKTKKSIKDLNMKNIESIEVLKGKNAIDKYGNKGKNGVIEIKTK